MNRNWLLAGLIGGSLFGAVMWHRRKKRRELAWSVDNSIEDVLQAHGEYLSLLHPDFSSKFDELLLADREAAIGEAAVFSLLKTYFRARPEPADVPGTGGVDFICHRAKPEQFVVEVTSLKPEAVAAQSGIPTEIEDGAGGPFKMTTDQLFSTVRSKADQLSNYSCPRVLAITSTHHAASFLMGDTGAEFLLTSEPAITYPLAETGGPVTMTTNLRRSVFFGPAPGSTGTQIVPRRQSVSAVLLLGLDELRSNVVGLLHPAPATKLNLERFRDVPFLRLAEWPIVDGAIRTEWVISSPESRHFPHAPVR
jgi:hypothetical protein